MLLDLVDVGFDVIGDLEVGVDDVVGDRVQDRGRSSREHVRVALQAGADLLEGTVFAVPDGDDEAVAEKDHDLAGLDDLAGLRHRGVRYTGPS